MDKLPGPRNDYDKASSEQTYTQPALSPNSGSGPCDTAVTNVNLIDLEKRLILRNVDVTMAEGRISAIRNHAADGLGCLDTIDGEGRYMMPGLVDMHTHANAIYLPRPGGYERITNVIPLTLQQAGKMLLTAGVTAFLDLCSAPQDEILAMRDLQRTAGLPFNMPDIYSAGSCITAKWFDREGDPAQFNREAQIADVTLLEKEPIYDRPYPTNSAGRTVYGYQVREKASELMKIDKLLAKRPDVLKVFYTRSYDEAAGFPSLHIDTIKEIVRRAHTQGIPVFVHALTGDEQSAALTTGADGLAHAAWDKLNRRAEFQRFQPLTPMIVITTGAVLNAPAKYFWDRTEWDDPLVQKVLASVRHKKDALEAFEGMTAYTKQKMDGMTGGFHSAYDDKFVPNLKALKADRRFNILIGDDASNLGVFLGVGMHQELEYMVNDVGFSTWRALAAATVRPGKFLKARYGSKVGDVANLILLQKNPISNIRNTRSIEMVFLRGKAIH